MMKIVEKCLYVNANVLHTVAVIHTALDELKNKRNNK